MVFIWIKNWELVVFVGYWILKSPFNLLSIIWINFFFYTFFFLAFFLFGSNPLCWHSTFNFLWNFLLFSITPSWRSLTHRCSLFRFIIFGPLLLSQQFLLQSPKEHTCYILNCNTLNLILLKLDLTISR